MLPAVKRGRQWLVKEEDLPSSPPGSRRGKKRQSSAQSSTYDVTRALQHVMSTDLHEAWVPDIVQFQDVQHDEELLSRVTQRLNDSTADHSVEVPLPKTPLFTRSAVMLSLEDRIAYQAVVASFAAKVEMQTHPNVYSARLSKVSGKYFFRQKGTAAWLEFRKRVRREYGESGQWIVKSDLTAYFDTISHDLLINEVVALNVSPRTIALLRMMLRTWEITAGKGIPQGPNVSRLLGNLFLIPVDRAMLEAGHRYFRYLDDVYILTSSKSETVAAIKLFERECRLRGLLVSSSKTVPLQGQDALNEVSSEADLDSTQYLIDTDQDGIARTKLRKILTKSLKEDGNIDVRRAKFSFWRLTLLREASLTPKVLARLEDLAPVAGMAMSYLRPFVTRKNVIRGLTNFLADENRSSSPYTTTWVLALMLDHSGPLPNEWIFHARRIAHDRNQPVYLRVVAANVMARGRQLADISWIKAEIQREFDPGLIRGYVVALARASLLDKNSIKMAQVRAPELKALIKYLQGRKHLPSLLLRDQDNPIGR
jgi:Reverse transcriptase (RNA-dependent DNA polymerase)